MGLRQAQADNVNQLPTDCQAEPVEACPDTERSKPVLKNEGSKRYHPTVTLS
jgi:hypothetical protein